MLVVRPDFERDDLGPGWSPLCRVAWLVLQAYRDLDFRIDMQVQSHQQNHVPLGYDLEYLEDERDDAREAVRRCANALRTEIVSCNGYHHNGHNGRNGNGKVCVAIPHVSVEA